MVEVCRASSSRLHVRGVLLPLPSLSGCYFPPPLTPFLALSEGNTHAPNIATQAAVLNILHPTREAGSALMCIVNNKVSIANLDF